MDKLKKFFPISFKFIKNGGFLALGIIIYIAIAIAAYCIFALPGIAVGALLGATGILLPLGMIIGFILGSISGLVTLYTEAGIIIQIIAFCNKNKKTVETSETAETSENVEAAEADDVIEIKAE